MASRLRIFPRWRGACLYVVWSALVLAVSAVAARPLEAQRAARCGAAERVRAVSFDGSPHFDDLTMAASIVTHEPGLLTRWFRIGKGECVDSIEVQRDALRLAILHRQAGWFQASVDGVLARGRDGVRVTFAITPGPEVRLDSARVRGLPEVDLRRPLDAAVRALEGKRLDRNQVDTALSNLLGRLRDVGYARARIPEGRITIDTAAATAMLDVTVVPGTRVRLGEVAIRVQPITPGRPRVDSSDVAGLLDLRPGDRYRATALIDAQQTLYRSEAFRLVLLDTVQHALPGVTDSASRAAAVAAGADSLLDLRITVAEARTRSARLGMGWATQDCVRMQGRLTDRGFLGVGRRMELSMRLSKLGVGDPADVAPALCSQALRRDPFSARLNYYVGTTFSAARLLRASLVPSLSVYSERRGEPFAYLRETSVGALAEVVQRMSPRTALSLGFQYENGKTTTDPVVSCTRFGLCRPEEVVLSQFGRGIGIVSSGLTHDRTNDVTNPSRGWRARTEARAGETYSEIVSSLRFYRTTGEVAGFWRMLRGIAAVRVQMAGVFAPGATLVDGTPLLPQQERLFVGGQNSVRGYQQNLLGPVVYVVSQVRDTVNDDGSAGVVVSQGGAFDRAVPRGGTAMVVGNLEWRRGFRVIAEEVQLAAFVDAGSLWESRGQRFRWSDLRTTPGLGLRVLTPLGPFRIDVGYRPYAALTGRALYFAPAGTNGDQILCASPRVAGADGDYTDVFACPATFRPRSSGSLLSRLVFHFGLGQAF
ncbi:MAG: BamA/TamA family outer membrane protein [Gemmatimonadetes bacterium]|nr:BamA/TamA family outer membrane protein [Gemmatimonadota bacterium]